MIRTESIINQGWRLLKNVLKDKSSRAVTNSNVWRIAPFGTILQFKKREKPQWRSDTVRKVAGWSLQLYQKYRFSMGVFNVFNIVQMVPNSAKHMWRTGLEKKTTFPNFLLRWRHTASKRSSGWKKYFKGCGKFLKGSPDKQQLFRRLWHKIILLHCIGVNTIKSGETFTS